MVSSLLISKFVDHGLRRTIRQLIVSSKRFDLPSKFRYCNRDFSSSGGAGFSNTWQTGAAEDHGAEIRAPDPQEYLEGFDSVPAVLEYKEQLLRACNLGPGSSVLDVGCGTATHVRRYLDQVGDKGTVTGIDISPDTIQRAQESCRNENATFQVANVYKLPFQSQSFDVVKEDRVLQHLNRPFEATQEMLRVTKPGGYLVIANPDFRSFQIDLPHPQQRWGDSRRPPSHLDCDLSRLTTKVLNGVIPSLCTHSSIGIQGPRLLHAAGCSNIELLTVPLHLQSRSDLEKVVPITYMAGLSQRNGAITDLERKLWLDRLEWEGGDNVFGVLNMYICRGRKPAKDSTIFGTDDNRMGTQFCTSKRPLKAKHDVHIRLATTNDDSSLIEEARQIVNNEYATSDTGTTLSSTRLRPQDIDEMVQNGELLLALDETTQELMGCVQVKFGGGLPTDTDDFNEEDKQVEKKRVAEFTCLAVKSDLKATVTNVNTPNVQIQRTQLAATTSRRGRGIGAALVRAAEAHARDLGATHMLLGIMSPAHGTQPKYKQWLAKYYLSLGYNYKETVTLRFETDDEGNVVVDQLNQMYSVLHQLVQCQAILFDKEL